MIAETVQVIMLGFATLTPTYRIRRYPGQENSRQACSLKSKMDPDFRQDDATAVHALRARVTQKAKPAGWRTSQKTLDPGLRRDDATASHALRAWVTQKAKPAGWRASQKSLDPGLRRDDATAVHALRAWVTQKAKPAGWRASQKITGSRPAPG